MEDPLGKLPRMLDLAEKLDKGDMHATQINGLRDVLLDENNVWHTFAEKLVEEVDRKLIKKLVECFFINTHFIGYPRGEEISKKYDINVPWAILMDPTSACNLSCTGCCCAIRS